MKQGDSVKSVLRVDGGQAWIADHRDEATCFGYGSLFEHFQYMAYVDYVVTTVALFDRDPNFDSIRHLWELVKKVEIDPVDGLLPHVRHIAQQFENVVNGVFAQQKKEGALV